VLRGIIDRSLSGNDRRLKSSFNQTRVHTVSRLRWTRMSGQQRRYLFATGSIHVVGPSEDRLLEDFKSWKDPWPLNRYLSLSAQRFVQGMVTIAYFISYLILVLYIQDKTKADPTDSDAQMFKASLLDYIEDVNSETQKRILNFLDLNMSSIFRPPVS
jgi:hypothetical protein